MDNKSPWISPDIKPEIDKDVLLKLQNPATFESTKILHTVGYYAVDGTWLTNEDDILHPDWIIGWMNIPE